MEKHICSKQDEIDNIKHKVNETHKLITGNGTPKEGLLHRVTIISERQDNMYITLNKIDHSLTLINDKYDETIKIAQMAKSAVEKFRIEDDAFQSGKREEKIDKEKILAKWFQTISIIIAILTFLLTQYNITSKINDTEKMLQRLDNYERMNIQETTEVIGDLSSYNLLETKI